MRNILIILLAAMILGSCSEKTEVEPKEESTVSFESEAESICSESIDGEISIETSEEEQKNIFITDYETIESPYSELENNARNPWDMMIYDGYLFVGAGDFDINISPDKIYAFDITSEDWVEFGSYADEQIDRFILLDGNLYIPGADPKKGWDLGNFYRLENGEFVLYRTIPDGVHCFDMAMYNGELFASLGVTDGSFPVAVSRDGGITFEKTAVIKDDHEYIENGRVYSLFTFEGNLYALSGTNVYRYDGDAFRFVSGWSETLKRYYGFYSIIPSKAVFNGKQYFTTGHLFASEDMTELEHIQFEKTLVSDITVMDDRLYILCTEKLDEERYLISVRTSEDGTDFERICEFEYPVPGISFALGENEIYVGMGEISENDCAEKGTIVKLKIDY